MVVIPVLTETPIRVSGPTQGQWTRGDWEQLKHDDGYTYEVIDGVLYMSTSPSTVHQWIIKQLYRFWGYHVEAAGLGVVYLAPVGVFMSGTQPVQPDSVFVSAEHDLIIDDRHINGAPDLIIEVLSPGNSAYDLETKFLAYERAGVSEYGIMDYPNRQLRLYHLQNEHYGEPILFKVGDTVAFACAPHVSFLLKDVFDGAPAKKF